MKLWYSTTSPFARKVSVVIKHHQLEQQIEMCSISSSFDPNSPHNQDNPLGRIPVLQRNCGRWLFGSLLIAEYLDQKGAKAPLTPKEGKARWNTLALHNLVDGILENTLPMIAEKMLRPEEEWWINRHKQLMDRNIKSFTQLECSLEEFGFELNIGTLTAVCMIDWWQFRMEKLGYDLAKNHPKLTAWASEMNAMHTVLAETKPAL
ncbi:glutathione S-transferase [Nicoletella semolina]|uniref:Glutathione S-transferase n=1 Tax=Nicoletella semolina TaxID=271160 RepID=A0A4R2N8Q3_9PAST|nr:glutathione S-transferase [Nicoletella semolina]MDH2924533.1 glutathione S-transferase [Nicoletella semolina]TCP17339.1 glutathione S-transferase [Nicoletella semolina]